MGEDVRGMRYIQHLLLRGTSVYISDLITLGSPSLLSAWAELFRIPSCELPLLLKSTDPICSRVSACEVAPSLHIFPLSLLSSGNSGRIRHGGVGTHETLGGRGGGLPPAKLPLGTCPESQGPSWSATKRELTQKSSK